MAKKKKAEPSAKAEYIARVLEALDETSPDDMSIAEYLDALSEIYATVDMRIDAAQNDAERVSKAAL